MRVGPRRIQTVDSLLILWEKLTNVQRWQKVGVLNDESLKLEKKESKVRLPVFLETTLT